MMEVDVFSRMAVPTPYTLAQGYTIHLALQELKVFSGLRKARGKEPQMIIKAATMMGFTRLCSAWVNQAYKKIEKSIELQ